MIDHNGNYANLDGGENGELSVECFVVDPSVIFISWHLAARIPSTIEIRYSFGDSGGEIALKLLFTALFSFHV